MSERRPLRVLLADDHVTVRHGLRLLVEGEHDMTVVGEASDGAAAVKLALECQPDVVVMDVSMPGVNGLVATRMLKKILPGVAVVTLTRHADDAYLQELLRAGASAYVLKQSPPAELLQAIRSTATASGKYVDSSLMPRVTARFAGEKTGGTSGTISGTHFYGPYVRVIPPLPLGTKKGKTGIGTSEGPTIGWLYNPTQGTIRPAGTHVGGAAITVGGATED